MFIFPHPKCKVSPQRLAFTVGREAWVPGTYWLLFSPLAGATFSFFFFLIFFFNVFLFLGQRETEHERGRVRERQRETQNLKQAPGSELSATEPDAGLELTDLEIVT